MRFVVHGNNNDTNDDHDVAATDESCIDRHGHAHKVRMKSVLEKFNQASLPIIGIWNTRWKRYIKSPKNHSSTPKTYIAR